MNDIVKANMNSVFATARPAGAFASAPVESLADGLSSSYGVIRYKGKVWALGHKGNSHILTRADDGSPSNYIDVVILRDPGHKSKVYFPNWEEGSSERPACTSMDMQKPDADVREKQSDACSICPKNKWYTGTDGKRKQDCKDFKRLAVLLMPDVTKRILGSELMEPVFLRVPPDSLTDLGAYGLKLTKMGWPYFALVTRIKFDPKKPHPKFLFEELKPLSDVEARVVLELREDPIAKRITGEEIVTSMVTVNLDPVSQVGRHPFAPTPVLEVVSEPIRQNGGGVVEDSPEDFESSEYDAQIAELIKM